MNWQKLPVVSTLIRLMLNDVFMQGLAFIGFSVLAALFGEGLAEYQDLIVQGLFALGAGMAGGAKLFEILAPFLRTHATQLSAIGGKAIDAFEGITGVDFPEEWEQAAVARLFHFFSTASPETLEALLKEAEGQKPKPPLPKG